MSWRINSYRIYQDAVAIGKINLNLFGADGQLILNQTRYVIRNQRRFPLRNVTQLMQGKRCVATAKLKNLLTSGYELECEGRRYDISSPLGVRQFWTAQNPELQFSKIVVMQGDRIVGTVSNSDHNTLQLELPSDMPLMAQMLVVWEAINQQLG
ncbi:hypothetical protein ACQ4M4_27685 [Leptolyngbya sp. AN02str]|uniref:hypothetical protein n=1 Tax=Leptolyngbya sp. AN02str TaxID=3423363 RepID=UPI003D3142BF